MGGWFQKIAVKKEADQKLGYDKIQLKELYTLSGYHFTLSNSISTR